MSITRRSVLKSSLVLGASTSMSGTMMEKAFASPDTSEILPLNSNSGVTLPPRGAAAQKFSFNFPEPSVAFDGYQISFRVYTYENTYAMDPSRISVDRSASQMVLTCEGLTWAGGQEKHPGRVQGTIRKTTQGISIQANASVPGREILALSAVVRGIPRGEISIASQAFSDPKENEIENSWAELMGGMPSPLLVIRSGEKFTSLSLDAEKDTVRTARFYMQPGEQGYRTELTYEREAWTKSDSIETAVWQVRKGASYEEVARPHYSHVEQAFALPDWNVRPDVPAWMHKVSLVTALHGAHWTGYIMNDYAQQLRILRWTADQIDPSKVMVFLPAWDGRYYWNYPSYQTDPRMGGDEGFEKLLREGQKLGFHFVAMFGSNVANKSNPDFSGLAEAVTVRPYGDRWTLDWVDWNNDRRGDANYGMMNLGVPAWRERLAERIADVVSRFKLDGYFLDIVGTCENNRQGDMFLGTRALVQGLRQRFPDKLCVGEMHYDALLDCIPVFQADVATAYPAATDKYVRMFEHLSWPAPGRGSTGVHEFGFSSRGKLPLANQRVIPTLTVVDDTFTKYRAEMKAVIEVAKVWKYPTAG